MNARFFLLIPLAGAVLSCGSGKGQADVAATVNGKPITISDVKKVARNFKNQGMHADPAAQGTTDQEKLYYTAVDRLVEQTLLLDDATKAGLTVTDEELAQSVSQLISMAGGEEKFQAVLTQQKATRADVERDMRTNLLLRAYFEHLKSSAPPVTDADVQKYFDEHPQEFGPSPEVHARHLLVRADQTAPESEKAEARKKAEEALARAKAGEPFDKLAKEYPGDPGSAEQGGDLGWYGPGRMVAPFDSASFALEPGQLSGVVQTQFGYHVIKVEEKRTVPGKKFEDMKEQIRQVLAQERSQSQFKTTLSGLKEKATLKVEPPTPALLDSLGT